MTNMSNKELSNLADDVINNSSIYKPKNWLLEILLIPLR